MESFGHEELALTFQIDQGAIEIIDLDYEDYH